MAARRVTIFSDMNAYLTPEERTRHAEQLKKAVERLRKEEEQRQHEQSKRAMSGSAKRTRKNKRQG